MSFGAVILAALAAGALSAQLAGGLFSEALSGGLFFLVAPLPLIALGFISVPLASLAAGLFGALLLALFGGAANAPAFFLVVGLPAFAACWLLSRRGVGPFFGADTYLEVGSAAFMLAVLIAVVSVFVTMLAEPDYETFRAANRAIAAEAVRLFMSEMPAGSGIDPGEIAESLSTYGPIASMVLVQSVFLFLVYLAARFARQQGRLERPWPDFTRTRIPVAGLSIMAASFLLVMLGGWTGLFGGYVLAGLIVLAILIGLAVIHHKARANPQQRWMVPAAWFSLIVLSPFMLMLPALFIAALGVADHVLDLRGQRRAGRS